MWFFSLKKNVSPFTFGTSNWTRNKRNHKRKQGKKNKPFCTTKNPAKVMSTNSTFSPLFLECTRSNKNNCLALFRCEIFSHQIKNPIKIMIRSKFFLLHTSIWYCFCLISQDFTPPKRKVWGIEPGALLCNVPGPWHNNT